MGIVFSSILAAVAIIFFSAGIVLSKKNYKSRFNIDYSLKNMFPFEINYEGHFGDNLFGNIALSLSTVFLIVFYATFDTSHTNGFATFTLISGIFSAVLSLILYFVPFKNLKTHVALSTFLFVFSFMLSISISLLNVFYWNQNHSVLNLVAAIIGGLIVLSILILIINPKLSLRVEGEEIKDESGETRIVRPKRIPYAYTEWAVMMTVFMSSVPLIIYLISIL